MSIKVTFDFKAGRIIIEGKEGDLAKIFQEAKSLAPQLSEIRIITDAQPKPEEPSTVISAHTSPNKGSLRDFAKSLSTSNIMERIAAIAFYVNKVENKPSFSTKEMGDWFGLCGFKKPAVMPVALSDAKRKYGYVENKGRDQWAITTAGENKILELKGS